MTGWEARPLGEVCTIKPPKAEARAKLTDADEVSFAPMEDLGIGWKYLQPHRTRTLGEVSGSYTYFADGDVLLAKITPCFENGKLGVARGLKNGVGFGSSEYIVLRPTSELDAEFLYYYLARPTFLEEGARTMAGAVGHKRVTKEFVERYPIPLPPLPEQRRIVAILDEAFECIATAKANAEKNLENARELFDGYLQSVFSQPNPVWVQRRLQDVCAKITDGTHQTPKYFDSGVVFLSSRNVTSGKIDWENIKYIDESQHLEMHRRVAPRVGDILLAKNGTTGVAAIVDRDTTFDIYVSLALIRSLGEVLPRFLLRFINSPAAKLQFNKRLKGVGVPNLHLEEIREVTIQFPVSREEQQKVVDRADELHREIEALQRIHQRKLSALAELKKSLLHQAFTGLL